jgi:(p)ppGpp synthase/HD superfamily hydrolase
MTLIDPPSVNSAQLAAMPLHAITEIYGQAGLARRLSYELHRLPADARPDVADAVDWAQRLHATQHRTREPYANHVLRVALRILCHYRVTDPDVVIAALLHDVVEDQPWAAAGVTNHGPPPRAAAFAAITARYGERVTRLVAAVTNPDRRTGPSIPTGTDWQTLNRQYVTHLATTLDAEPWARVLKLSDFTDNGVGIIHTVGPKVRHSARKYNGFLPVLRELLARPDTPLPNGVKNHINAQLDLAEHRFAAILDADADL